MNLGAPLAVKYIAGLYCLAAKLFAAKALPTRISTVS
jgi:hypothetical protein